MANHESLFWTDLHSDSDGIQDPEAERVSATLLLHLCLWSTPQSIETYGTLSAKVQERMAATRTAAPPARLQPATPQIPTGTNGAHAGGGTEPFDESGVRPGLAAHSTLNGSAAAAPPQRTGSGGGGLHKLSDGSPAMVSPDSVRYVVGSVREAAFDADNAWGANPDVFPRHTDALRKAKRLLRELRHSRDPFAGPTPSALSPGAETGREAGARTGRTARSPLPGTPGGYGRNRRRASGVTEDVLNGTSRSNSTFELQNPLSEGDVRTIAGDFEGLPADETSLRLLQDVLLFTRRDGVQRLQRRRVDRANGTISLGHLGGVFIDAKGRAGDFGLTTLPRSLAATKHRFVRCACLDYGVALVTDQRGELYMAGGFREHVPDPPRGRTLGIPVSGPPSLNASSPAVGHDAEARAAVSSSGSSMRLMASNVADVIGSRARLAALRDDGVLVILSPSQLGLRPYSGLLNPLRSCRSMALGQNNDVFYIDQETAHLGKLGINRKDVLTPRRITTLQQRTVFTMAAGNGFSIAVDTRGCLWATGRNEKGQLGVGSQDEIVKGMVADGTLGSRYFVTGVSCGRQHAIAVTASGTVFVTGDNRYGQLGLTQEEAEAAPHRQLSTVNRWTKLPLRGPCVAVACGTFTSIFVLADGSVLAAGNNDFGQCGVHPPCSMVNPPQQVDVIRDRGGLLGYGLGNVASATAVDCCCTVM